MRFLDFLDFLDFLRSRLGPNWVVARRTKRIVDKYGADVVTLSRKRYSALVTEYEALYGPSPWRPKDRITKS